MAVLLLPALPTTVCFYVSNASQGESHQRQPAQQPRPDHNLQYIQAAVAYSTFEIIAAGESRSIGTMAADLGNKKCSDCLESKVIPLLFAAAVAH